MRYRRISKVLMIFIIGMVVLGNMTISARAYDFTGYADEYLKEFNKGYSYKDGRRGIFNNGADAYSSNNGQWLSNSDWGTYSTIRKHKQQLNPPGKFYFGYERGVSFPKAISNDDGYSINIECFGYGKFNTGTTPSNVRIKVDVLIENIGWFNLFSGIIGGYNNSQNPVYTTTYKKKLTKDDWAGFDNDEKIKAIKVYVNEPGLDINNMTSSDLYVIDGFSVNIEYPENPIIEWACPTNADYIEPKTDNYWYKQGHDTTLGNTFKDGYGLMQQYISMTSVEKPEIGNIIAIGYNDSMKLSWTEELNTDYVSDATARYVGGSQHEMETEYRMKLLKEGQYKYYAYAINNQWRWQLLSKKQEEPIDTHCVVGVDGTSPKSASQKAEVITVNSIKVELTSISDKDSKGLHDGSGFSYSDIAIAPKGATENEYVWEKNIGLTANTKNITKTLEVPTKWQNNYGNWKVVARLYDKVGNYRDYTIELRREDPIPRNSTIKILKYKYKNNNDYWVNTRENFSICTNTESSKSYSKYPDQTLLMMGNQNTYNSSVLYNGFLSIAAVNGSDISQGTEKDIYLKKNSNYAASKRIINGSIALSSIHDLKATDKADGRKYKLHTLGRIYDTTTRKWYQSSVVNSIENICIDGTAPACTLNVTDRSTDTFTIKMTNLSDKNGSGVKNYSLKVSNVNGVNKDYVFKNSDGSYSAIINRYDFKGALNGYTAIITLEDNVDNVREYQLDEKDKLYPFQQNLTAKGIAIYDTVDQRFVTQVVSGLKYKAVFQYENTGEEDIKDSFDIALKIDGEEKEVKTIKTGIKKGETKYGEFEFTAGEENLLGVQYEGIVDYNDDIYETNEDDNVVDTAKKYDKLPVPPTPAPPTEPVPSTPIPPTPEKPIQTVVVDYEAEFLNSVAMNSDKVVDELLTEEDYRLKFNVKNNSSYPLKNLDIKNKSFVCKLYYDNIECRSFIINEDNDIETGKNTTYYFRFKIPNLSDDKVEDIKKIRGIVDVFDTLRETNEDNNEISTNKRVLGLKVTDYRITDIIDPPQKYTYPIYTQSMPTNVNDGYNVTFRCNVKGHADEVYAELKDTNGIDYGKQVMKKVRDIDSNNNAEYEYVFTVPLGTPKGTIIISKVYAKRNSTLYDYNLKEKWEGESLSIGGSAKQDIVIFRQY